MNTATSNDIKEVQSILFDQLRKVRDVGANLDVEVKRTSAMLGITHQIIETGKLEFLAAKLEGKVTSRIVQPSAGQLEDGKSKLLSDGAD